jgi:hypothetical protein
MILQVPPNGLFGYAKPARKVAFPAERFQPVSKTSQLKNGLRQVCSEIGSIRAFPPRPRPEKKLFSEPAGERPNKGYGTHYGGARRDSVVTSTTRITTATARLRCDCNGKTTLLPPTSILLRLPPSLRYPLPFPIDVLCFLDWVCAPSSSTGHGAWTTMRTTASYQLWL